MDPKSSINLVNEELDGLSHYGSVNPAYDDEDGPSNRDLKERSGSNSSRKKPLDTYFNEQVEVSAVTEVSYYIIKPLA